MDRLSVWRPWSPEPCRGRVIPGSAVTSSVWAAHSIRSSSGSLRKLPPPTGAMNKTSLPSPDCLDRQWFVVDAADQTLGRLASEVARVLRGKNKPTYTPHLDTGDFVVVINAEKVRVSGNKPTQKLYRRHSGRPGGMKTETFAHLQARLPERIIETAVKGMLPHNALGRQLFRKLKVYRGAEHPHAAQQPQPLALDPAASALQ